jgi:hypothetical protein
MSLEDYQHQHQRERLPVLLDRFPQLLSAPFDGPNRRFEIREPTKPCRNAGSRSRTSASCVFDC